MMGERRVVIVRDADKFGVKDLEILEAFVQNPSPSNCLVLTGTKPDLRRKPFASLKKSGRAFESKPLYENQVPSWLEQRVRKQGRELSPEGATLLAAYVGSSLRELQNELDKLYLFAGEGRLITGDDVAALVGKSKEYTVFELQKAVGARDVRRSFTIAERMLELGEGAPFIIVMLTSYFTTLWKLHELRRKGAGSRELASEAKVNPYFLKEYAEALDRYSADDVESAFVLLAGADEQIKTTATDPLLVVESLLVRLIGFADAAGGEERA
jgi:DNA polymerase-3 subunit delta